MTNASSELFRIEPLTECYNFLSLVETLIDLSERENLPPFSILFGDLNYLSMLNRTRGHVYGDSVIRWMGIVLREETNTATYRIAGDEFAVFLMSGTHAEHEQILQRIFARLDHEAEHLQVPSPAAAIALIHYAKQAKISPEGIFLQLGAAMMDVKRLRERKMHVFDARDLKIVGDEIPTSPEIAALKKEYGGIESLPWWIPSDIATGELQSHYTLRWALRLTLNRVAWFGHQLDQLQETAYTDSVSNLPNMRAALLQFEQAIKNASATNKPFAILLMDGDNLRIYNDKSYATGDEMIRRTGITLTNKLRPGDFVARWRSGDEFLAILPDVNVEGAHIVAERFRLAVKKESDEWNMPTSISIGIVIYPQHGNTINALIDRAESALKQAKDAGKDRVVVAD